MQTIKYENTTVTIDEMGAELKSFKYMNKEIIWQSNPDIWSGSAPILFPFVGRLKNGKYSYNGKEYILKKHGFAKNCTFNIETKTKNSISFTLESSEETKVIYPFDFLFRVKFFLKENILDVEYDVKNRSQDSMYFSLGSHPGIALPLENTTLDDYYIEFNKNETLCPYKLVNELLKKQPEQYLKNENIIKLNEHIFDDDALIFSGVQSTDIFVKNNRTGRNVKVSIGDTPDLGIWAKPGAPYVCIEPWFGYDDLANATGKLEEKAGIVKLNPNKCFKTGYSIEVIST